ncbi:MAG: hypothetical protein HY909_11180 [Deltaproteobacteria bacterium]|nr:hypothetical protein [Deltaproteobacteria bacterium]
MDEAIKFLLPITILVVPIIVLVQQYREAERKLQEAWTAFAGARGLEYLPPKGRVGHRIEGTFEGARVEISLLRVKRGYLPVPYTRVTTSLKDPLEARVDVISDRALEHLGALQGKPDVLVGDPVFDTKFLIRSSHEDDAKGLLDNLLRRSLTAFPQPSLAFLHGGSKVELLWHGREHAAGALDAACRIVVGALRWRGRV